MPSLEEAVVTTLFDQSDEIADLVANHNPLLMVLNDKGLIRRIGGGYEIRKPVMYNQTAIGGFYSGYEAFDLDASVDATAFQFAIKQVYEPVAISGREKRANREDEQLLDVVEMKIKAAIARLKNTVSTSLRGDGTAFGGREFDGLKKAVSTSPTSGTYGGITRSSNSFAQNVAVTVSGGFTAANIQGELTDGISRVTRDSDSPDIGLMDRTTWKLLHQSLTAIQRITSEPKKGKAGFRALNYDNVDFYFDGGAINQSTVLGAGTCRLLNSDFWSFELVRGADFKPLEPKMDRPVDQDAFFTVILAEGNLCCSAPPLQAVLS
jgi:hypothetical protein